MFWPLPLALSFIALVFIFSVAAVDAADVTICSWNVQVFGREKAKKPDVMKVVVNTLARCDVALMQELRDQDPQSTSILTLLAELNTIRPGYSMIVSERLGRTASKEQYVFFYRKQVAMPVLQLQWPQELNMFERPPFGALFQFFRSQGSQAREEDYVFFTGIHTKPTDSVREIDSLVTVYDGWRQDASVPDWARGIIARRTMFMGDMNAGCDYVRNSAWPAIRLRSDATRFNWLISDATCTMVATNCPYDRMVTTLPALNSTVIQSPAQVFRFDREFGLNITQALAVSDHQMIWTTMRMP